MRRHNNIQEGDPSQVLDDGVHERAASEAVFQHGEAEVAGSGEDNRARQPDLKTVLVVVVDLDCVQYSL